MSHAQDNDELVAVQTEGYNPGEKKGISELQSLDANDESLNKWKASLGLNQVQAPFPNDPRTVIVQALVFESGERTIVMDVSTPEKVALLKNNPIVIKEGVEYSFRIEFYIQHDVVSGLKLLQHFKRRGIILERTQEMCGSFGPKLEKQQCRFPTATAPSGWLACGTYTIKSKFVDDDNNVHLEWVWSMEIKKEWD
ncbi:rho GDP dissociation inhibitor [Coemansia sp. Benny D115]|nr:rho GDP dissociation inhibitor [Coemansia sp. Benny D115]